MGANVVIIGLRPAGTANGQSGELLNNAAEFFVTRLPEIDPPALATFGRSGAGAGQGLDIPRARKSVAMIAELDQEGGEQNVSLDGQGLKDEGVGMRLKQAGE